MKLKSFFPGIVLSGITCIAIPVVTACVPHSTVSSPSIKPSSANIESTSTAETIDGLPVQRLDASIVGPTDIEGLIKESQLIVIGTIEQSLEEATPIIRRDSDGEISSAVSMADFKVKKIFKGNQSLKNQLIKVGYSMAIVSEQGEKPYIRAVENVYPYQKKGRYLLFLSEGGSSGYYATTLFVGRHNLDGSDKSEENINDPSFQEIRKLVRQRFKDD
jgi:hypothetical protein